jgi:two-component system, LuxR family, sensor kinase FixL
MGRKSVRTWMISAGAVAAYVLLDAVSYIHPTEHYGITPWNPQPSVAIALLILAGQRWLPTVIVAVLAAEWIVRGAPAPWLVTMLMCSVLALGYGAMAAALTGRLAISPRIDTRRDVLRLVLVVLVGSIVTGLLYVSTIYASGLGVSGGLVNAWMRFWIGDAVGILVTLPVLLMASDPKRRAHMLSLVKRKETLVQAGAILLALWAVFDRPVTEQVKFFYLLFLPLVWIAARHGMIGATLATLAMQAAVIVAVLRAAYPPLTVFEVQALLIALTVTGLFLGIAVDEQQRAEEDLRRSLRLAAASEMAAALAHELNQPLAALSNFARASTALAENGANAAQLKSTLARLVGEADRAATVVQRLRDFFRTGATELRPASISAIAASVVESLRPRAAALGVQLEQRTAEPVPCLLVDAVQIEIVLRNLIANAIDAAAANQGERRVSLLIEPVSRGVRGTVADSGSGVASADAERIFEPFATNRATGMGMGLAICRAIIEAHGGRIWSEPGPAGLFRFTLPPAEPLHA